MNDKLVVVAGGAGRLGRMVIDALVATPGVRVRALVRNPEQVADLAGTRVTLHAFDAASDDPAARAAAVAGAFSVVSTLQGGPDVIVDAQLALAQAASGAGARRFIPSDYSYNHFTLPAGLNMNSDWRRTLAERAVALQRDGFEVVHVLQGIFADAYVLGFLGLLDGERRVVRYWGDGHTPIDWTTWQDTARFTAAAAVDERPVPRLLFVRGDRVDVHGVVRRWEEAHGAPLTLERLGSLDDLAAETARRLQATPQDMYAWLPLMYARGIFGGDALLGELENHRYPDVRPSSLVEAMRQGLL